MYFGNWGPVVVLTASALMKVFMARRFSRARIIRRGSARTGIA
jgi:hypothetical protein